MSALGALLLLAAAASVVVGAWAVWRWPAAALPVFAVGLALHNLVLMLLVGAGAPTWAVRALEAWKEAYVGLLAARLGLQVIRSGGAAYLRRSIGLWSRLPVAPRLLDLTALAFELLLVVYALLPSALLPSPSPSLAQRLLSFRTFSLIPVLYLFGRVWPPLGRQRQRVIVLVIGVAAVVSLLGLLELWFVPSRLWVDWGIVRFDQLLGFDYHGPGGLPENFFQSTTTGLALRRMVSTYLSPLGIAYTGLLVVPLAATAAAGLRRRSALLWALYTLVVIGIALSVTRLALACLAVEVLVMAVAYRRRAFLGAAAVGFVAIWAALFVYPDYGPVVNFELTDVRPPAGAAIIGLNKAPQPPTPSSSPGAVAPTPSSAPANLAGDVVNRIVSSDDASIQAHIAAVREGAAFVLAHPLGLGLGASMPRLGVATGPGESAIFQIGGEAGLLGLILFSVLYGGVIAASAYAAWRNWDKPGEASLFFAVAVGGVALSPVVLTSQVWGDFSVTFMFWLLAGACIAAWPGVADGGAGSTGGGS